MYFFFVPGCQKCVHFKPYLPNPNYEDLGKCSLYRERPSNRTGYAEGARYNPDLCGLKGKWFKPIETKK